MKFDDYFNSINPDPLVQKKKKYANFTVKEIGGPAEIIVWRQMQEAKEASYRAKLGDRDLRLNSFESETGQKLETPKLETATWEDKIAFAQAERERLAQKEKEIFHPKWEIEPEPKKTLKQKIASFFTRIWKSANF